MYVTIGIGTNLNTSKRGPQQMTELQWREVEAIVRREQVKALQHMNNCYYEELGEILDELYDLAHPSNP